MKILNREILNEKYPSLIKQDSINLSNNDIEIILQGTFNRLEFLKSIDLSKNKIKELNLQLFIGLKNLTEINLQNNNLENINGNCFRDLEYLKHLCLSNNNIKETTERQFCFLNKLELLDLDYNQIKEIHPDSFRWLKKLINLKLNNNNFNDILINQKLFIYLEKSVKFVSIKDSSTINNFDQNNIINKRLLNKDETIAEKLVPKVMKFYITLILYYKF